ncbi:MULTISPECIES: GNAT family N-acetyltransferase [unclassified Curtobacterium]|uniref:GNAT family N-acetyltransferase n=1 Tax=unclassified Curtobacterium TaxID=257496 RepID=UPI000F4CD90E|nr:MULTISPECIES: GNAT family N-acetyltransferase [unclassified Curtobacterium]ROP61062.1 [SSU ribosomal protein S5P]-alanine acetyltransferase [Curtobacterium sp. ZW137]TCK64439.1 [SSU ribosomal protein S5P]-alanine acetyltransferase [Curtobacterium sp. PhB136]
MEHDVRPIEPADAPALASLLARNRAWLAPWDPYRPDSFFTEDGQRTEVTASIRRREQGTMMPLVITTDGAVVGRMNLNSIVMGAFCSATLGYWVSEDAAGRGAATAAVGLATRMAFERLGLHRVEAGTLPHNERSQRVLEKNGFERYGYAPRYLRIAGEWQDHVLFQRLAD